MKLHLLFLLALTPGINAMTWSKKTRPQSLKVHVKTSSSSGALESAPKPNSEGEIEEKPLSWEEIQGFFVDLSKDNGRVLNSLIDNSFVGKIGRSLSHKQILEVFEYGLSNNIGKPNSEIEFDEDENTPLHLASRFGKTEMMDLLLKHKAKISALNAIGETPLHAACRSGKLDAIALLLNHGAKTTALNAKEETPLALLLKHGIKAKNNDEVALLKNILQQLHEPVPLTPKAKPVKK